MRRNILTHYRHDIHPGETAARKQFVADSLKTTKTRGELWAWPRAPLGVRRSLLLSPSLLFATLLLSGCLIGEQAAAGTAIKRAGEYLLVAVCGDISADYVGMDQRNVGAGMEWTEFFQSTADREFSTGDMSSTDPQVTPPEHGDLRRPLALRSGDNIVISVVDHDPVSPSDLSGFFEIGHGGLSESLWLQQDGSTTVEPCLTGSE